MITPWRAALVCVCSFYQCCSEIPQVSLCGRRSGVCVSVGSLNEVP